MHEQFDRPLGGFDVATNRVRPRDAFSRFSLTFFGFFRCVSSCRGSWHPGPGSVSSWSLVYGLYIEVSIHAGGVGLQSFRAWPAQIRIAPKVFNSRRW